MCVAWCRRSPVCPIPSPWWSKPSPWVPSPASISSAAAVVHSATSSSARQRSSPPHRSTRRWGGLVKMWTLKQIWSHLISSVNWMFSREHRIQEGKVVFPLGVSVQGDVAVSVYHMRSTIGGRLQAKVKLVWFILWAGGWVGVVPGVLASSIPLNLSYTSISMSSIHYFPLFSKQEVCRLY